MEFQSFLNFDKINPDDLPPVMRQYYGFKAQYKSFILFFREGEFFETYFDDALEFSNVAGVALTSKKFNKIGKVLMSGIPNGKIDIYVEKLINAGYKVAIVDQTPYYGENKRLIRKITKVYTQGTLLDTELLDASENNYLAAIYKNNNKYEICYADISVGRIYLSVGSKDEVISELARISPKELLIQDENLDFVKPYKTEILPESAFIEGALGAVLYYAKYILKEYIPKLETPHRYSISKNLLIDFYTRKNLELTKNSYNNKKYGSLLWALDRCKTPMGKRLLSYYISTPLYDMDKIKQRQDALKEFLNNPNYADRLGILLENIGDILRLTSGLSNGTITVLEFLTLKNGLKILKEVENICSKFKTDLLLVRNKNGKLLSDFSDILEKTIQDDIDLIKAGNYIKSGANKDLDILSMQYEDAEKKLTKYEAMLREYTKISSLKIIKKSGEYSIEIPQTSQNAIGCEFKLIQALKNSKRYVTDELIAIGEEIFSLRAKIDDTRREIFENLKNYSKEMTTPVREYSNYLAVLDVLFSLYTSTKEYNMKCPEFTVDAFSISKGRHVAAEKILGKFYPLDFDFKNSNFVMLTGENGIGKSTLLKQIAALIVMAQSGFYVPCENAKLPLIDKLFTVLNVSDEFVNKKSAHQAQMHEIACILENLTDRSLLLLDEVGKSTSYKEGVSISYGLVRYCLEETGARTVFATHYLALNNLLADENDKILYLKIDGKKGEREIKEGIIESSKGIFSAQKENLPDKIIDYANDAIMLI